MSVSVSATPNHVRSPTVTPSRRSLTLAKAISARALTAMNSPVSPSHRPGRPVTISPRPTAPRPQPMTRPACPASRIARYRLPCIPQRTARTMRPPSSGAPGSRLNRPRATLTMPSQASTRTTASGASRPLAPKAAENVTTPMTMLASGPAAAIHPSAGRSPVHARGGRHRRAPRGRSTSCRRRSAERRQRGRARGRGWRRRRRSPRRWPEALRADRRAWRRGSPRRRSRSSGSSASRRRAGRGRSIREASSPTRLPVPPAAGRAPRVTPCGRGRPSRSCVHWPPRCRRRGTSPRR